MRPESPLLPLEYPPELETPPEEDDPPEEDEDEPDDPDELDASAPVPEDVLRTVRGVVAAGC